MKKLLSLSCLFAISVLSCNTSTRQEGNQNNTTPPSSDSTVAAIQIPNTKCYREISGRDTITLKIEKFPNVITGNLTYSFHEKDKNTGEIEGKLMGDTLIADYSFLSEGRRSVRQVAFLLKDSIVVEGYGDMEEKGGRMLFKNINKIDFSKGTQLSEISCIEEAAQDASRQ